MKIDEQLFKRIQNYMLIGVLVLVFFLVVHAVFSSGMINAGDNEYIAENSVNNKSVTVDSISEDEESTQPTSSISKSEKSKYEVITVKPRVNRDLTSGTSGSASAVTPVIPTATHAAQPATAAVRATTTAPTAAPSTVQPTTIAPHTTEPHTTAPLTTAPHTTAPHTTAPVTTAPATTVAATTAPSTTQPESTAPTTEPSSTDPSAATSPSTEPSSTDPSASIEPTTEIESTVPSTAPSVPTTDVEVDDDPLIDAIKAIGDKLIDIGDKTDAGKTSSGDEPAPAPAGVDATSGSDRANDVIGGNYDSAPIIGDNSVPTGDEPIGMIILAALVSVAVAVYFANRRRNRN